MAKDDYKRIVCIILTFLYARLRKKTEERPEVDLQPMTKDFPIDEEYFYFILNSLEQKGFITGIKFIKAWGGDIINITGISDIQITPDGIEYLCESKSMRRVLEWLRDNAVSLPGMVTTIIGILNN